MPQQRQADLWNYFTWLVSLLCFVVFLSGAIIIMVKVAVEYMGLLFGLWATMWFFIGIVACFWTVPGTSLDWETACQVAENQDVESAVVYHRQTTVETCI